MDSARFNRILQWTPEQQGEWGRGSVAGRRRIGETLEQYRSRAAMLTEQCGPPAPWPVIMLAQRLHWHGRTQEAYNMAARLS